jgi:hypothetical protein
MNSDVMKLKKSTLFIDAVSPPTTVLQLEPEYLHTLSTVTSILPPARLRFEGGGLRFEAKGLRLDRNPKPLTSSFALSLQRLPSIL